MDTENTNSRISNHFPSLDGLRAVSILLVIGSHISHSQNYSNEHGSWFDFFFNGGVGVNIFFVISGFLITYLLSAEERKNGFISLKRFYIRRMLRIFPVYYLFLLTLFLLDNTTKLNIEPINYLSSIFYLKNYFGGSWIDGHLWSLAVEEQFYFLWPFVFYRFQFKGRVLFATTLILLAPLFRVYFYMNDLTGLRLFSFMTNMDSLLIGSLGGFFYFLNQSNKLHFFNAIFTRIRNQSVSLIFLIFLLGTTLVIGLEKNYLAGFLTVPFGKTILSLAALVLIIKMVNEKQGFLFQLLNFPPVVTIGVLSYSIYIWQQIFFVPYGFYSETNIWFLDFPVNLTLILITAACSYYFFEKPFLALKKNFK